MASKIKAVIREVEKISAAVGGRDTTPAKWMGKWKPEIAYGTLHKVEHLGSSYVCIKGCVGVDPEADVALGDGVQGVCWLLIAKGGRNGVDGTVAFEKLTEEQRESLKGDPGLRGNSIINIQKDAGYATGKTLSIYVKDYAQNVTAVYQIQMPDGPKGAAATVNGVNALTIEAGDGIDVTMSGSTLTIKAKSHEQAASTVTAGTFAGQVVANSSGQTPGTALLRNSKLVSTDTDPTVNGEINWTYG